MSDLAWKLLPYLGFAILALAAVAFASFAVLRGSPKGRWLLAGAIALFLLGVGGGSYWMLGQPGLALRASLGLESRDTKSLVPYLIARVRKTPNDERAWIFLGRTYFALGDAVDSAKAYGRAVTLTRLAHTPDPDLLSTYGEALVAAEQGVVGSDAEDAFNESYKLNPKDAAARFFLGQARAVRGDRQGAIALWQSLLADVPDASPLHKVLVDRIALATAQGGGGAPDPKQMVARLAARLKAAPDDPAGWQSLIRAYSVLGQKAEAKDALATARKTFASRHEVLDTLDNEAKDLQLQ